MVTTQGVGTFGTLLLRYRVAASLSQEELAERTGLSRRGIADLERGRRRSPHPATVRRLVDALKVDEVERAALLSSAGMHRSFRHNLPAELTSFIGREQELAEVRRLLVTTRLLTLVGTGGVGKTRLALEAAKQLLGNYPDGVGLADLAPLADSASIARVVAAAFGIAEQPGRPALSTLVDAAGSRRLLLVLDNCEHMVQACAELSEILLRSCPSLTILATSREPLDVAGEVIWRVPSLGLPDPDYTTLPAVLAGSEAVRLFAERARLAHPDFAVTDSDAALTAHICRRLDGIPLAIELAAARLRGMTVAQIAARLDDRFRMLTGGARTALRRQQTLRGAVDWSYDLLSESEQAVLRPLAVFAGDFALEAAEAVCVGEPAGATEAFDVLLRLVDKSLVQAESEAVHARYRLLETIRQYTWERLVEAGEQAGARSRHRDWCLALAEAAWPNLIGADQRVWVERLEQEHDNMRAALAWSLEEPLGAEPALRLAGALHRFWWRHGHTAEGSGWLARALARAASGPNSAGLERARLRAMVGAGVLARAQGEYTEARSHLEASVALAGELGDCATLADATFRLASVLFYQGEQQRGIELTDRSLTLWREIGDPWGMSMALASLAILAWQRGDYEGATELQEKRLALARQIGDEWGVAAASGHLGILAYEQGQHEHAAQLLEGSRRTLHELGDRESLAWVLRHLGLAAVSCGNTSQAIKHVQESLTLFSELRALWGVAECLEAMAIVAREVGDTERAATLWAKATALRAELAYERVTRDAARAESELTDLQATMGASRVGTVSRQGERLSMDEAVAFALATPNVPVPSRRRPAPDTRYTASLTRRECEVASSVASGLTNQQIGVRLTLSERTVENHLAHIFDKLALRSRTQVARWAIANELPDIPNQHPSSRGVE